MQSVVGDAYSDALTMLASRIDHQTLSIAFLHYLARAHGLRSSLVATTKIAPCTRFC